MSIALIYKGPHWMDELSQAEIDKRVKQDKDFQAKYDARYQPGDVVEVREDGAVVTDNERTKFNVVAVPHQKKSDVDYLQQPEMEVLSPGVAVRKKMRQYKLDKKLLPVGDETSFDSGDVELATLTFTAAIVDKSV